MSLFDTINEELKTAMRARDKERLEALRAIKTAFLVARSEKGASHTLSEADELKIIAKLVKQRQDSADIYKEQGREDLYAKEMAEMAVISAFMPEQMEEGELREKIAALIREMGADSMQQMGPVMGRATKELAGKADGKMISQVVRELLSK